MVVSEQLAISVDETFPGKRLFCLCVLYQPEGSSPFPSLVSKLRNTLGYGRGAPWGLFSRVFILVRVLYFRQLISNIHVNDEHVKTKNLTFQEQICLTQALV